MNSMEYARQETKVYQNAVKWRLVLYRLLDFTVFLLMLYRFIFQQDLIPSIANTVTWNHIIFFPLPYFGVKVCIGETQPK